MANHNVNEDIQGPTGSGLEDLLSQIHLPAGLDQHLRLASQAAYSIDQMRRYAAHDFGDVRLDKLIRGLADFAGVAMEPILASMGLPELGPPDLITARSLGRLTGLLGLGVKKIETGLRWAFAEACDPASAERLQAAFLGGGGGIGTELKRVEASYPVEKQVELEAILRIMQEEHTAMGQL